MANSISQQTHLLPKLESHPQDEDKTQKPPDTTCVFVSKYVIYQKVGDDSARPPNFSLQSLFNPSENELSATGAINCDTKLSSFNFTLDTNELDLCHIFSIKLSDKERNRQLRFLQSLSAKIGAIDLKKFTSVHLVNLDLINGDDPEPFKNFEPQQLIILHGSLQIKSTILIRRNLTLVGNNAKILVANQELSLDIDKAVIKPLKGVNQFQTCKGQWELIDPSIPDESFAIGSASNFGISPPLIHLREASLLGGELRCLSVTQAIVASNSQGITISYNRIVNPMAPGVFLINLKDSNISSNAFSTKHKDSDIGLLLRNCEGCFL